MTKNNVCDQVVEAVTDGRRRQTLQTDAVDRAASLDLRFVKASDRTRYCFCRIIRQRRTIQKEFAEI